MKKPRFAALALLLALSSGAAGQQAGVPAVEESIVVRVVNVEAQVTDAAGRAVTGLKAAEFRLWIDGAEVPIDYFSEVAAGTVAPPPAAPSSAAAEQAPQPAPAARNFLVFIDDSFAIGALRDYALNRLESDLARLGPADRMALVAFDGTRLAVLCGWSGERRVLAAALARARQRPSSGMALLAARRSDENTAELVDFALRIGDAIGPPPSRLPDTPARAPYPLVNPEQVRSAVQIVQAAGAAMRALPVPAGRKALLFLSSGLPLLGLAEALIRDSGQLGYTVYPVELQGIDAFAAPNDVTHAYATNGTDLLSTAWQEYGGHNLAALANETGGRVLSSRADYLAQSLADTSSYYSLGFTATRGDALHRVRVEVRRPGVTVRARRSYYTLTAGTQARMAAQGVLMFGGDPAAKRIEVSVGSPRFAHKREIELPITLEIPVDELPLTVADAGYESEVAMGAMALDSAGRLSEAGTSRLRASFPTLPARGGIARFHIVIRLRSGAQRLVFAVPNALGGATLWGEANVRL